MNTSLIAEGAVDIFPVFTSNRSWDQYGGSGRALHLGTERTQTLCGMDKVHPHLLWDSGFPIEDLEQFLTADPDDVLCQTCKSIARSLVNR